MLTYDMNTRGKMPRYQFLYQCIRNDILQGVIRSDEKLPSKRALARHLHLSVVTVENAYHLLEIEGYIYAKERSGYFAERLQHRPAPPPPRPQYVKEPEEREFFADFSSNKVEHSLFPNSVLTKLFREVLSAQDQNMLKTVPYNGTAALRYAIANYLINYRGMQVDPGQVIIGCGTEYLYGRLLECFAHGGVLGLEDPGNHKFAKIAERIHLPVRYLPLDKDGVSIRALRDSDVSVLHLSPANIFPTGRLIPIKRRLEILNWLYENEDRYLIEDDFDCEFNTYGTSTQSIYSSDYQDRTIYLNSFSKSMLPSLRVAYMILPRTLLKRYRDEISFYSCTVSSLQQTVLAHFIERGHFERHLSHVNNVLKARKTALLREVRHAGLHHLGTIRIPLAGTAIFLENLTLPASAEIAKRNAEQLDVRLAFVADYMQCPTEEAKKTLILNYASVAQERFPEALRRVRTAITYPRLPMP